MRCCVMVWTLVMACIACGAMAFAGPRMATNPMPTTEIHGMTLPDPVAAARHDAARRQSRQHPAVQKTVGCRYPAVIKNAKLLGWINTYSKKNRLDPRLVYALIEQESRFNACAVSPKGAQGLMQIMPDTQRLLELRDPFDPEQNIAAGTRYLRQMLDTFQTEVMALAAYNAGPGAVSRHGGVPPFDETKDYVLKVVNRYFYLRLRYPEEGIGVIHKKLAAGRQPSATDADNKP